MTNQGSTRYRSLYRYRRYWILSISISMAILFYFNINIFIGNLIMYFTFLQFQFQSENNVFILNNTRSWISGWQLQRDPEKIVNSWELWNVWMSEISPSTVTVCIGIIEIIILWKRKVQVLLYNMYLFLSWISRN